MQDKTLEKRIDDLTSRLHESEGKFSRHMEVYEEDRRELKAQMGSIIDILTPMSDAFKGSKFTADLFISFLKFITIFGGAVTAVIYVTVKLKEFLS